MIKAEALIVPSIWYESAGLTIIESQFLNTPCIVSKFCSKDEFLKMGCTYNTIDDLKKCIAEKKYLQKNQLDLNKFSAENYIYNIIKYYEVM